jgi:hypothetical protein
MSYEYAIENGVLKFMTRVFRPWETLICMYFVLGIITLYNIILLSGLLYLYVFKTLKLITFICLVSCIIS